MSRAGPASLTLLPGSEQPSWPALRDLAFLLASEAGTSAGRLYPGTARVLTGMDKRDEAVSGLEADAKASFVAAHQSAGGFHRMVDADGDVFDEAASGFGRANAARVALEQEDAEVFLKRLDPRADARLADAERVRGMAEGEMLGDGERLDQGRKRDAPSE